MEATGTTNRQPLSRFLQDYTELVGGMWEEVEPQVFDLLLPPDAPLAPAAEGDVVRVALDPEAIADHASAQLLGFGTPIVDELLDDTIRRGAYCRAYLTGLHLRPAGLAERVLRGLQRPEPLDFRVVEIRPLDFPQAVFWFEATLTGDQKETHLLTVAIDMHYAREVRHLEALLDPHRLQEHPDVLLPQVKRCELVEAKQAALTQALRSIRSIAGGRSREVEVQTERKIERVRQYYGKMREELAELQLRAEKRGTDTKRYVTRRTALDREERIRVAELQRNSRLAVTIRPACVLMIHQPKLQIDFELSTERSTPLEWQAVWDPLLEKLEPVNCPSCLAPTLELSLDRRRTIGCPRCQS